MTEKRIRQLYGALLSLLLVGAAVCLMVACVNIYHSPGAQTYTPQKVAEHFRPIAPVVYAAVFLTLGGFVLYLFLPGQKLRLRSAKNPAMTLERLHKKLDYTRCEDAKLRATIQKEQKLRKKLQGLGFGLLALGSAIFLAYALRPELYARTDSTAIVINALWVLLPCMAVPFAFWLYANAAIQKSFQREIRIMLLVATRREPAADPAPRGIRPVTVVRYALLVLAVVCILGGFLLDGWKDVLTKAVNICTECVGLG